MSAAIEHNRSAHSATAVVTFVVPVRDDAERLRTALRSIAVAAGDTPHDVIVLDHGSRDGSDRVAQELGARVIAHRGGNVAGLRNLGAAAASTDLIAFVDADNQLEAGWLAAALAALARQDVGMVGAAYHPPVPGTHVQRAYDALRRHPAVEDDTEWLGAGNMVVRRQVFEAVGGFDESLETCEDVDLCVRVAGRGWRLREVPGMRSVHHGDPARLSDVFWGELWRGRDNLRVTLRGPRSLRMLASAAMPIAYAAAVVGAIAGLLYRGPLGWTVAVTALAGLVALLVLRMAAMRRNAGGHWPAGLWAAMQVATAYDAARSAAVFIGVGHGRRRRAPDA